MIKAFLKKKIPNIFKKKYYKLGKKSKVIYPNKIINPFKDSERINIGKNTIIKCEIQLLGHGGKVTIGDYCFIGENSYLWSGKSIEIGNRVLVGHNCNIYDNDVHPIDASLRHKQYMDIVESGQPRNIDLRDEKVLIMNDVWIGVNVTILKGVVIGEGAIIGANSLVTKDVKSNTINAGNPLKYIRTIK